MPWLLSSVLLLVLGLSSCYGPIYSSKYISKERMAAMQGQQEEGDSSGTQPVMVSNTETLYEKYPSGQFKSRRTIEYKSLRRTVIEEHRYRKADILLMFTGLPKEEPKDTSAEAEEETDPGDSVAVLEPVEPKEPVDNNPGQVDTLQAVGDSASGDPLLSLFTDTMVETEIKDKLFWTDDNSFTRRRKQRSYFDGGGELLKVKSRSRSKLRDGCEILVYQRKKVYNDEEQLVYKEHFCWLYWRQVRYMYTEEGKKVKRVLKCQFKPKFRNYP